VDFDRLLEAAWPWMWPSGLWLALVVGAWLGLAWLGRLITRRVTGPGAALVGGLRRRTQWLMTVVIALGGLAIWASLTPVSEEIAVFVQDRLSAWLWPSLALAVWLIEGNFLGTRLLEWLAQRALASKTEIDDTLVAAVKRPLLLILLVTGLYLWVDLVPLPERLQGYFRTATSAGAVLLLVLFVYALLHHSMVVRARTSKLFETSGGVLRAALRVVFGAIAAMLVLSALGVDITPVLASLGLGSIAIGLALQKTLEDFLAGLQLAADQTIRVGDFVSLEAGQAGTVTAIGWRTTQIRTREDTDVIVPNSKLAQSIVVNRSLTAAEMNIRVAVGVGYRSDLDQVVRVTREVACGLQETAPSAVPGFEPGVQLTAFGESRIELIVWLRARSWLHSFDLQDRAIRALHQRYGEAGIVIPFPIRTLDLPPEVLAALKPSGGASEPARPGGRSPSGT
jgi:small-conductance mechanosensitive channel